MLTLVALGAVVLSLVAPPAAQPAPSAAQQAPPADRISIEVVKVNGSGCRKQTAIPAIAPDGTAFTVTYSEYLALVGPGAKPRDAQKDCKLTLTLSIPAGHSYAVTQADYRGFASLATGATGVQTASYKFQGGRPAESVARGFTGPLEESWQTTDLPDADLDWAPCGKARKLTIDSELRVAAGTSDPATDTSLLAMDSTDGAVEATYRLTWKRC
jgi:hypothetical protein